MEPGSFEIVEIDDFDKVYDALKSGKADAFYYSGVAEINFIERGGVAVQIFYPLVFMPVSMATRDPQLSSIISVVEKALKNNSLRHLTILYNQTHKEYLKYKLYKQLAQEEREYIKNNPVVPVGIYSGNYPSSFYDSREKEWRGIFLDILDEISLLTGLTFKRVNDEHAEWSAIYQKLMDGEIALIPELTQTADRAGYFIWPQTAQMTDYYALISHVDYPDVKINEVLYTRVGLAKNVAYTTIFKKWFPDHLNTVEYESMEEAFAALRHGEVDMVMANQKRLLYLTHYLELPDYKTNIVFDYALNTKFGFNKDEGILASIFDKALGSIDSRSISEYWMKKTYDYQSKIAQAQRPWFVGSAVLSLFVLVLLTVLFRRSRSAGRQLEELVKKRTHELTLQTTTLTTLFDSIPDLIFTKDLNLRYTQCNKSMLEYFAKSKDDIIGKGDIDGVGFTKEETVKFNERDNKVINECKRVVVEELIPRADGVKQLYETIKMPLVLNGKVVGILGIARDVTKRSETTEAALAASRSKSSFLANMSHEIRTPMNAILGITEILMQNETLSAEIEEGLDKIYTSGDLLLGIINDILDLSKIEADKLDITPVEYKVAGMLNDSAQLNIMRISGKPIGFELLVDERIPAKLIGDELRIKQIINNLLSNAFKYTDSGNVTLSVTAGFEPEKKDITLVLNVRDTGHGMTKEQLGMLFDEYSRFNRRNIEGTGLGLAITRRLVNLMNGKIHVESAPDKGTSITIRLSQSVVNGEALGKEVAANLRQFRTNHAAHRKMGRQIVRDPMPYGKVLIVDDVETNLYVAMSLLKLYKLQIDTVMSGPEAIEIIKSGKKYDIVFMDHMMPEMDGITTTKYLRGSVGYTNPIVALTANAVVGQAEIFLQNGFDDFISKPIDMRKLNSVLNRLIRDRHPQEAAEAARHCKGAIHGAPNGDDGSSLQTDTLLIESFVRDVLKVITMLEELEQKANWLETEANLQKFTIMVHGIKSSLRNINETKLSEFAYKLEIAGKERNTGKITASAPEFLNELRTLAEKLKSKQESGSADGTDEDTGGLCKKLQDIREMCAVYNRKGVLDLLAEIKNCSNETKTVLDSIKEHVIHSDFDEAQSPAAGYAAVLGGGSGL
jgi:PAS domain S-box-containing protein